MTNKITFIVFVSALALSSTSSIAETRIQTGGSMPVQNFTQCNVDPVYSINTRGARIRAGGYALHDLGNGQWQRSYDNSVFQARRHLVAPSYTYLDPDVAGITPCS